MRGARLFGPADLRIVDLEVPVPGPGQVLVRVMNYAPYGTDLGVYLNREGRYVSQYPVGIGADFSGTIAALGEGVSGFIIGDRVTAQSLDSCGTCRHCESGRVNLCLSPEAEFARPVRQICCQQFTLVPMRKLAPLPDTVSFQDAAMLTGVVDALNAFDKMGLVAGDRVAIIGVGAMGHGAIAAARGLGLRAVAIGGRGGRARIAEMLGASPVIPIEAHDEDVSARVLALFPEGFDAVLETTASSWGMGQAFAIAAPGAIVALTGGGALPVLNWDIVNRELRIVGVRGGPDQRRALALIAEGRIDLTPTIGGHFPLERADEAFAMLVGEHAKDIGRVMITIAD